MKIIHPIQTLNFKYARMVAGAATHAQRPCKSVGQIKASVSGCRVHPVSLGAEHWQKGVWSRYFPHGLPAQDAAPVLVSSAGAIQAGTICLLINMAAFAGS
jgi:hypothetical protein